MKDVTKGVNNVVCEGTTVIERVVGVFIVSLNHELLLQRYDVPTLPSMGSQSIWAIPRIVINNATTSLSAVQEYVNNWGMEGELYEAFIIQSSQQPLADGHIAIVLLTSQHPASSVFGVGYQWVGLERIIRDIHERPSLYTSWFRTSLESVVLYLKKLLKNRSFHDKVPMHSDNV